MTSCEKCDAGKEPNTHKTDCGKTYFTIRNVVISPTIVIPNVRPDLLWRTLILFPVKIRITTIKNILRGSEIA